MSTAMVLVRWCPIALLQLGATLLVGAIAPLAYAVTDGYSCGFVVSDSTYALKSWSTQTANIRSAILNLRFHNLVIENTPPGTTGWSDAQITAAIARVRADYAPLHIYFNVTLSEMPVTSEYYYSSHSIELGNLDQRIGPELDNIDVILAFAVPEAIRPEGTSWGADMPTYPPTRCIVNIIADEDFPVLSHEIGHCMGLLHTNEFSGIVGSWCGPEVRCEICQDLVCDTTYDWYLESPMWHHVDRATCQYDGEIPYYEPPLHNIMAYTWPRCMTGFTPGQGVRMLRAIEVAPHLQNCLSSLTSTYENKSADTNLLYTGTPYSSIAFDYDGDSDKDLFITMRDNYGSLQQQFQMATGIPQFQDRTYFDFPPSSQPQIGLRGATAADYDNDGWVDLFVAGPTQPRLYHNNSTTTTASLVDYAATSGLAALADSSYAGAWGDFDRDGQIDLYVCRADGGGSDPTSANLNPVRGRLLRNDGRASGMFVDRTDSLGSTGSPYGAAVTASWADIDGDKDLDLFVGDLRNAGASASSRLYLNNGAGGLADAFADRFLGLDVENVNSATWTDMNNDAALDLVLGSESAAPTVYLNNGSGDFAAVAPLPAALAAVSNGVRPVDSDLDGRQDILALPRASSDHRWLFWNRLVDWEMAFLDQSYNAGFTSTGRVDGVAIADFNGDGDSDMFFGRPESTDDYFYQAHSSTGDQPTAHWVAVTLVGGGGNNRSAIGAKVRFSYTNGTQSFQQVQVVDGGSGKGGQADNVLICGLGAWNAAVNVEVTWPGGFVQTATVQPDTVITIEDATVPGITTGKTAATHYPYPHGWADWEFTWETNFSCDPSRDKVTVSNRPGQPSQCQTGTIVLTPATYGVEHTVLAKVGGGYKHKLIWRERECIATCVHNYTVESATDDTHKSTSPTRTLTVGVCIGDMEQ